MNKKLFGLLALSILLTGCTTTKTVDTLQEDSAPKTISIKTDKMTKSENSAKKMDNSSAKTADEKTPKQVVLHTSKGDITIKLFPESAPKITESFWRLAKSGKYNNVPFHRVIKDFMIQTGDFENYNGTGGSSFWGGELDDEIDPKLSHTRGMVSMANRGPNTNGSQFFIVHKDSPHLNGGYSIFGEVVEGMDVVDEIAETAVDGGDKPLEEILIKTTSFKY